MSLASFDLLPLNENESDKESESGMEETDNSLLDLQTASELEYKKLLLWCMVSDSGEEEEEISLAPFQEFDKAYSFEVPMAEEKLYQL